MEFSGRRIEFDYLRAFVTVLVVLHHAVIAYSDGAFINIEDPIKTYSPVADLQRWVGFDLITGLNDVYFMALMFFISGLFVWPGLQKRGGAGYLKERFIRLGIPFLIAVPLLIPLAYYPAQLTVELVYGGDTSYMEFWSNMVRSGFQTAGPLWFLWLLLVYDALATLLYKVIGRRIGQWRNRTIGVLANPLAFRGVVLLVSIIVYVLSSMLYDPTEWIGVGPFVA